MSALPGPGEPTDCGEKCHEELEKIGVMVRMRVSSTRSAG